MSDFIKRLSPVAEFLIVILCSFGFPILNSVAVLINNIFGARKFQFHFADLTFSIGIIYYSVVFAGIILFLRKRGKILDLNMPTNLIMTIIGGIILCVFNEFICSFIYLFAGQFNVPENLIQSNQSIKGNNLNPVLLVIYSIINSVFKEVIVVGYTITELSIQKGTAFAVNISIIIRVLFYLHAGPVAIISIIPLGLIYALAYLKWKNIWMLIAAEMIVDLINFSDIY